MTSRQSTNVKTESVARLPIHVDFKGELYFVEFVTIWYCSSLQPVYNIPRETNVAIFAPQRVNSWKCSARTEAKESTLLVQLKDHPPVWMRTSVTEYIISQAQNWGNMGYFGLSTRPHWELGAVAYGVQQ